MRRSEGGRGWEDLPIINISKECLLRDRHRVTSDREEEVERREGRGQACLHTSVRTSLGPEGEGAHGQHQGGPY